MGIQCRIIRDDKGKVSYVEAPNGNRSKLYDDAIEKVGEESALDIVLTAYTPSFTEEVKNPKRDAFRKQLINRIQTLPTTASTVTLNLEDLPYNLDLSTLEMVSEDLGNGETLMSFTAEMSSTQDGIAPNGKKSNLTPKQYAEVRTPQFMEWSNNWNDVVKDENGEPEIFYHGTSKPEFYEFNSPQGINFFSSDIHEAGRYMSSRKGRRMEVYIKTTKNLDTSESIPEFMDTFLSENIEELDNYLEDLYSTSPIDKMNEDILDDAFFDMSLEQWSKLSKIERAKFILERSSTDWQILEYPPLLKLIEEQGYTSMNTKEGEGVIGIFGSSNNFIKSATDNRGTFNIGNPDIRKSQGDTEVTPEEVLQNLADRLVESGLAREVNLVTENEIKEALEQKGDKYQQGINGFVIGDTVYINKERAGLDTPIHEFGHLWNSWMQENAPQVFDKGISLIEQEGQAYIDYVRKEQPSLEGEALLEEALAQAIGDSGARLVGSNKNAFVEWLQELWESLKGALGLANTSVEEFQNLTLNEFAERAATDLLSGSSLEELMNSQAGSVGSEFTVRPDAPITPSKRIERFDYNPELTTELPRKTLNEVIEEYEGRVFIVTSDATGVGYDSKGDPIYGGVGFMAIKENVDGKIGFASLDKATVKKTLPKISGRFGKNKKVAVLVMVQNADATVGNYYGAKYFGRGLRKIKEQSPEMYDAVVDSIEEYIDTRAGVRNEFKDKYKNGELVKKSTHDAFIKLLRDVDKYSETAFADEFIKDTTFESRRTLLQGLIIKSQNTRTDSGTPLIKQALKDVGFDQLAYLKEYGDNTIFTEEMYAENAGGFVVGGFEYTTPDSKAELNDLINEADIRGINHPQFNGKIPTTGENFYLDGLYPVNENFEQYAKQETAINNKLISKEEVNELARKNYTKETDYQVKYRKGGSAYMPMSKRGYTQLRVSNKTALKNLLAEMNPDNLKVKVPNVVSNVASGKGFYPETESSRKDLVRSAGSFARFSIRTPEQAEAKTIQYLDRINKEVKDNPKQYWSVDIPSREVVYDAALNDRLVDTNGGMAVVKADGDIVGVFKYFHNAKGVAKAVLRDSISKGGVKLDNFDGYLTKLYKDNGFRITSRMPFNEEFAPAEWDKKSHGTPDVVFMVYDPAGELSIEERKFDDYDEALQYRNSFLDGRGKPRFSVGFMQTKKQPEGNQVTLSNVETELQGQGVGTEMYKQAATQAVKNGSTLVSDFNNKGAEGIWSKFRQEDMTEPVDVNGKIVERIKTTPDSFDVNGEPSVSDVVSYIQSKNYENETLSEEEIGEVQNTMMGTSMTSSNELYRALKRAFTPNGVYNPSETSLVSSGVYSRVEARRLLDSEEYQLAAYEMMHKLKNSDAIENNVEIDPDFITLTSAYNSLGTLKKANPFINEKTAREVLGGIKDQALFYNQSEVNDIEYANKKFSEISNLKKLSKMIVSNGTIRPETNLDKLRTRFTETLTSTDNESLGRNLDYALAIPNEVWNLEFKNVRVLLEAIEKDAVDIGLDLSSLNEESYDKTPAEVKSLLNSVRNFVSLQNESTFEVLLGEYITFFDISSSEQKVTLELNQGTKDKTLVYSEAEVDSYNMFKDYGLLPLGNNLYQKVNNNKTLLQAEDIIYETLQSGNNIIPKSAFKAEYDITNPENEVYVKEDISRYIDEQVRSIDNNANYDTDTLRKMVLFSKYFNTKLNNDKTIPSAVEEATLITDYPRNAEYLTTEFMADFNKKMLKEKVKDSKAWKEFYKHFDVSSKGLELLNTDPITMREIQPYLTDNLVNHFRLKKEGINLRPMEDSDVVMSDITLRNYYSNFPKALPLFKESYHIDNGTLVANTNPNFIRVDEGVFEYVETVGNKALYSRLSINNTDFKAYSKGYSLPNLGEISKFNITAGVKANKKINHLYSKAKGNELTNEIDNC